MELDGDQSSAMPLGFKDANEFGAGDQEAQLSNIEVDTNVIGKDQEALLNKIAKLEQENQNLTKDLELSRQLNSELKMRIAERAKSDLEFIQHSVVSDWKAKAADYIG